MPLTNLQVQQAKARGKKEKLWDGGGLYLEVPPSGSKRWRLKYRFAGKEKLISLGVYPQVSLKEAREQRDHAKQLLEKGINPSEQRKSTIAQAMPSATNSFEAVSREWHALKKPQWSEKHSQTISSRLENNIYPWLGARPIDQITAPELLESLRRIEDRGAIETARRVRGICSEVFGFAIATGKATLNPARDLKIALSARQQEHLAAVTEPDKVGALLRMIDGYEGSLTVRCGLKLAPLLFARPGELRTAKWEEIDLNAAEWRYVASKTKQPHIVPLARQAIAVLEDLKPLTGSGIYVFPNDRDPKRPMTDNALLGALRRLGISKEEMTIHGWRAVARTLLDEVLNFRPDFIEHQLAHSVRDPNGRAYNRTAYLPQRHQMMQAWADYLDDLRRSVASD